MIDWRDVSNKHDLDVFLASFNVLEPAEKEKICREMVEYLNDYKGFAEIGIQVVEEQEKRAMLPLRHSPVRKRRRSRRTAYPALLKTPR